MTISCKIHPIAGWTSPENRAYTVVNQQDNCGVRTLKSQWVLRSLNELPVKSLIASIATLLVYSLL
ncbi:MAG TPA: hypothetical protein V6D33_18050 [Cyanophyceae cyanobacterium]